MAQYGGQGRMEEGSPPPPPLRASTMAPKRPRPKGRGLEAILCTLSLLVIVGVILYSTLFRLVNVNVIGAKYRTTNEVILLAGLSLGDNILLLDEEKIRAGINSDRYLIFQGMQRDYPDGLILHVFERVPRANIQSMGVQYTLDNEGMILEQTELMQLDEGMIAVTGLDTLSCTLGQYITCRSEDQLTAYRQAMSELSVQDTFTEISELNVADVDNLYLVSVDGFSIRLGTAEDMRAKVGSMRAVLAKLREMGREKGSVDVSDPVNPTYIPAE